jgi:hypothetical protein
LQPIRNRRELLDDSEVSKRFTWGGPHSVALSIERRSLRRTPACYQCAASHDSRCAAPQHRPARQRARQVSREPMRPQQMQQSWSNKCLPVPDIEGIPHVSDPHSWAESATSSRRTRSKSQERPKPARTGRSLGMPRRLRTTAGAASREHGRPVQSTRSRQPPSGGEMLPWLDIDYRHSLVGMTEQEVRPVSSRPPIHGHHLKRLRIDGLDRRVEVSEKQPA